MSNLLTNFAVSGTFRCRHMGQHLSDGARNLVTMTVDFGAHGILPVMRLFMLQLCTEMGIFMPSNSAHMTHFRSQH